MDSFACVIYLVRKNLHHRYCWSADGWLRKGTALLLLKIYTQFFLYAAHIFTYAYLEEVFLPCIP